MSPGSPCLAVITCGVSCLGACAGDVPGEGARVTTAVHDSSGLTIVVNTGSGPDRSPLRLADEPELSVGVLEGDEARMFAGVTSALRLGDGTLVVADRGSRQLRAFDRSGGLRWVFGGRGEGPGQFQQLVRLLVLPGDTILAWDNDTNRVTLVSAGGGLARSYLPEIPEGMPFAAPFAVLADGRMLSSGSVSISGGAGATEEILEASVPYFLVGAEGAVMDSAFTVPIQPMRVERLGNGGVRVGAIPFTHGASVAAAGDRIVVARGEDVSFERYDGDATLRRRVRLERPPRRPAAGDLDLYVAHRLRDVAPEAAEEVRRSAAEATLPAAYPSVSDVLVAPDGSVWLERWYAPWEEDEDRSWWLFDADGAYLGTVHVPAALEITSLEADVVVGVLRDELDVERVVVVPLVR